MAKKKIVGWREKLADFEKRDHPDVDRDRCGWNDDSEKMLTEQFINEMGLGDLYDKYMDRMAAEELAENDAVEG